MNGAIDEALELIECENNPPLEIFLIRAKIFSIRGNHIGAATLLKSIKERAKFNLLFNKQLLQHQMDARDGVDVKQNVSEALSLFGEHPHLLYHCTALNLFGRQPGLGRRSALLQQTWASVTNTPIVVGNQVNSYEGNGYSDWMEYLLPSVTSLPLQTNSQLHSNLIMQLASSESKKYKNYVESLVKLMSNENAFADFKNAKPCLPQKLKQRKRLRVGWISGDLDYHPVSRFLLGFFAAAKDSLVHSHEIVSTQPTGPASLVNFFREECNLTVLQLSGEFDSSEVLQSDHVSMT